PPRSAPITMTHAPPAASGCGPSVTWPPNSPSAAIDQPRRSPSIPLPPVAAPPRAPTSRPQRHRSRGSANPPNRPSACRPPTASMAPFSPKPPHLERCTTENFDSTQLENALANQALRGSAVQASEEQN